MAGTLVLSPVQARGTYAMVPRGEIATSLTLDHPATEKLTISKYASESNNSGRGYSLFDELFAVNDNEGIEYSIPYPFQEVVATLESTLGDSINGGGNRVRSVMIPLGRCINRYAGGPDYFANPRIVVAVDTEHNGTDIRDLPYYKDRIFIGYQEKTNSMEIISYNEIAGRFDFQRVQNYGDDTEPVVTNVTDDQCTECHQNSGPIFAQSPWDETNNNRDIFARLVADSADSSMELPVFQGSDADEIDGATNRTNMFAVYQTFWQGVCEGSTAEDAIRCRAGLFEMVLLHRLQERNRALSYSQRVYDYLLVESINGIAKRWPDGVSVVSSDIKNENPLVIGELSHLHSAAELRIPRSVKIRWQTDNLLRVIAGIGRFISLNDLRRLDNRLYQLAQKTNAPRVKLKGKCQLSSQGRKTTLDDQVEQTGDISVNCDVRQGNLSRPYYFLGDFTFEGGVISSRPVYSPLAFGSDTVIMGLTHNGGNIEADGDDWLLQVALYDSKHRFHARLPDGSVVDKIDIRWPHHSSIDHLFSGNGNLTGSAELYFQRDLDALDQAISRMIALQEQGAGNYFSAKPFRGRKMVDALLEQLDDLF